MFAKHHSQQDILSITERIAMDNILFYSFVLSSASLLLLCAAKVSYSLWWRPKWLERQLNQQGIKGSPYKPLVGDMKEFMNMITEAWSKPIDLHHRIVQRVDPFTLSTVQKYGKLSLCWAGKTPRLIIVDPEVMKEVLSNKLGHFGKPYINPEILILSKGLTSLEGETWANHRRIINPAFHLEKLKGMIQVFSSASCEMIEQWKNMVNPEGSLEIDVWPELQRLTADIIAKAAFGGSYEEGKRIFELQRELMLLVVESMRSLYIPGFRYIPTKKNQRRKKLDRDITSMLRDMIKRKESAVRAGESREDDILGMLLQSNYQNGLSENTSSEGNKGLTIEDVIEECKVFNLAGYETTSSLLTWTMVVLAMHPEWQEKAREEVNQVCSNKELNFDAISHLKIVTMIIYEILRLYPPAIASYQHAYKETKIGNIFFPAGVDITLPTLLIHHDPEYWGDDADEFKPERFSEGISKASKDHVAFFPFGWGPRTCIGQNFALIEAKVVLAMILQHFWFELSPTYTHAPYTTMILQPQHGAHLIIHQL